MGTYPQFCRDALAGPNLPNLDTLRTLTNPGCANHHKSCVPVPSVPNWCPECVTVSYSLSLRDTVFDSPESEELISVLKIRSDCATLRASRGSFGAPKRSRTTTRTITACQPPRFPVTSTSESGKNHCACTSRLYQFQVQTRPPAKTSGQRSCATDRVVPETPVAASQIGTTSR